VYKGLLSFLFLQPGDHGDRIKDMGKLRNEVSGHRFIA
jgi:hypothetical protein